MKLILTSTIFVLAILASLEVSGQAGTMTLNGAPYQSCGNAAGQLGISYCSGCTIIRWEEGTLNTTTNQFTVVFQYPGSPTFTYNIQAPGVKAYRAVYTVSGSSAGEIIAHPLQITADVKPVAGTLSTATTSFLDSGTGQLILSGSSGNLTWYKTGSSTPLSLTNGNFSITETTEFYAQLTNGICAGGSAAISNKVKVKVYKTGILTGPESVTEGSKVNLQISGYDQSVVVRWEYSVNGGSTWTNFDYYSYWNWPNITNDKFADFHEITTNTKFRVLVDRGPFGTVYSNILDVAFVPYTQTNPNPANGGNYVRAQQVTIKGVTDPNAVNNLVSTQKHEVKTYLDGKGRTVQQNIWRASANNQVDLIAPVVYDREGRTPTQYLPYVSTQNDGLYRSSPLLEQSNFYVNGTSDKVADSPYPFTATAFEKSPLGRVTEQGNVGQQWQLGGGHSNLITYSNNIANEVWQFKFIGAPASYYGVNELTKFESIDADQKKNQRFVDKSGRTILSRAQLDETVGGTLVPWLETYYIYNETGAVKYILPPTGVDALKTAGWVLSQAIVDLHAYQFIYDTRGRLIEKKVPGQAWNYFCYDRLDRLVLMKDANTGTNNWIYIKYDRKGRPVMQGIYTNATYPLRSQLQLNVIDPLYALDTDIFYEERGTAVQGYTNQVFPTTGTQVLTVNYYDNYDFDNNGSDDFSYVAQGLTNENTPMARVTGLPTGSKRLIMNGGSNWLFNYIYYDVDGHAIQGRSNNHLNPSVIDDLTTAVYDFEGKVTLTKKYHNAGVGKVTTVIDKFTYDHMGRVKTITQNSKNNNSVANDQLVAKYEYNELGQLVDKKLHELTPGSNTFLQSVDMRYSIQGWLSSINNSQLTNDGSVTNDETTDYFGMEFIYEKTETGLTASTDALYNGSISAVKWKGPAVASGAADQRSYKFTYDKTNRFKTATSAMSVSATSWTKEANGLNESVTEYDLNGNIKKLQRNQRKHTFTVSGLTVTPSYGNELIDDLTYTYNTTTAIDQLSKVTDAATRAEGFDNGTSSTNTDFTYTANGDLTSDLNKGVSAITYNHLGKPTVISFSDTRKIEYTYDANGTKLTMKTYKVGPVLQSTTDYVNGFVYQDAVLSFFSSPEGRVVNNSGTFEYQYAIADNQGNTRVVFTSAAPGVDVHLATFEDPAVDTNKGFQNVPNSLPYWAPSAGGPAGTKAVQMNQNFRIGPAKSLKVYPGDKIDMEVWTYYTNNSGYGTSNPPLTNLITAVASSLVATTGGVDVGGVKYSGVNSALTSVGPGGNRGDTQPAAYLNYILFDKNFKLLDMGYTPATGYNVKQKISIPTRNIKEAGYIFIYLSYEDESNNYVQFDDLKITHTKTNIIQYNEYYPFGLQAGTSWTRENSKNDFLYNAGSELNTTTDWYETFFRNYDAALGRFISIDQKAVKYSSFNPYNYGFNNPVMVNDPLGAEGETSGQTLPYLQYCTSCTTAMEQLNQAAFPQYSYTPGSSFTFTTTTWVSNPSSVNPDAGYYEYTTEEVYIPGKLQVLPGILPTFRRINEGEDVSNFVFVEAHGHIDLGAQIELTNTPLRDIGKLDAASVRLIQVNLRFYFNHKSNEVIVDILSGSSMILLDIANDNVSVYSALAAGFGIGGEVNIQRSSKEFNFMWFTGEVANYFSFDSKRDSWSGSVSIFSYNGGSNPTISATYGGSAALGLGFDGSISLHVPIKLFKKEE